MVHSKDALFYERQCVVTLILQTANERTHVGSACLHGHISLLEGVDEVHVNEQSLLPEQVTGAHAFQRHGNFEHSFFRVETEVELAFCFGKHFLGCIAKRFDLEYGYDLGELYDEAIDISNAAPVHKRGRSGKTRQKAEFERLLNFVDIGRIKI